MSCMKELKFSWSTHSCVSSIRNSSTFTLSEKYRCWATLHMKNRDICDTIERIKEMYMSPYRHTPALMCAQTYLYILSCTQHTHKHTHTCIHVHVHVHKFIQVQYLHVHVCTHIYMYMYIHIHTAYTTTVTLLTSLTFCLISLKVSLQWMFSEVNISVHVT